MNPPIEGKLAVAARSIPKSLRSHSGRKTGHRLCFDNVHSGINDEVLSRRAPATAVGHRPETFVVETSSLTAIGNAETGAKKTADEKTKRNAFESDRSR
jgi:hypothetical protein